MSHHYFGYTHHGQAQPFHSPTRPTPLTHPQYHAVVGPYHNRRQAELAAAEHNLALDQKRRVFTVPPHTLTPGDDTWS